MEILDRQESLLNEAVKVGRLVFGEIERTPINATVWPSVEKGKNLFTFHCIPDRCGGDWFQIYIPAKHKKLVREIKANTAKLREGCSSAWFTLKSPKKKENKNE